MNTEKFHELLPWGSYVNYLMFIFISLISAFCIYKFNVLTPHVVDDLLKIQASNHIHSSAEFFKNLYHFYMSWGGRIWGEAFALYFLSLPKTAFNIINTLGYVVLTILMYINIVGRFKVSPLVIAFVNLSLWAFVPAFGQDILWLSGAANYLWTILIPLAILALFRFFPSYQGHWLYKAWMMPIYLLASIFAGWANESLSITLLAIMIGYVWMYRKIHCSKYLFAYINIIGTLIGTIFLWAAPGNFARLASEQHASHAIILIGSVIGKSIRNAFAIFNIESTLGLLIIGIIIIMYIKNKESLESIRLASIVVISTILGNMSIGVVTTIHTRIIFISVVFITISVGILLSRWLDIYLMHTDSSKKLAVWGMSVLLSIGIFSYYSNNKYALESYNSNWNGNLHIIENAKLKNEKDVFININPAMSRFNAAYKLDDIQPKENNQHWLNKGVAKYFNLKTIQSIRVDDK